MSQGSQRITVSIGAFAQIETTEKKLSNEPMSALGDKDIIIQVNLPLNTSTI
jgi:hypothetical protein